MKKLFALALLSIVAITTSAQEESYKAAMEQLNQQGQAIVNQYRELMKNDPKNEKPTTLAQIAKLELAMDSLSKEQVKLVRRIARENKNNMIPVPYIKDTMYELGYEGL